MYPTIDDDDVVLVGKLDEGIKLKRGDIVVFLLENKLLTKRIFALPKEKITVSNNKICNSIECIEDKNADGIDNLTFVVPIESYFVIGDNLENSRDSRYFDDTFIKKEDMKYVYLGKFEFL